MEEDFIEVEEAQVDSMVDDILIHTYSITIFLVVNTADKSKYNLMLEWEKQKKVLERLNGSSHITGPSL